MKALVFGCVVALVASVAAAQMVEDFEVGNLFSAGTVVADPDNAANNVLYIEGVDATLTLSTPLTGGQGISMKVYDQGKSAGDDPLNPGTPMPDSRAAGNINGWNIGISGTYNFGVALINRTSLGINGGYGWVDVYYGDWPTTAYSLYSIGWFGGPRQIDALSIIGTGSVGAPEIPGDGAWSTWLFALNADGSVTISNDGITHDPEYTTDAVETTITSVYLSSVSGLLGGVWVDDVQIVTSGPTLQADFDDDGDVDLDDFVILKSNFGTGTTHAEGDADYDGDVDLDDFVILKNEFGS